MFRQRSPALYDSTLQAVALLLRYAHARVQPRIDAIRALFDTAPARDYFDVRDDYSFHIDAALFEAQKPSAQ